MKGGMLVLEEHIAMLGRFSQHHCLDMCFTHGEHAITCLQLGHGDRPHRLWR